MKYPLHTQSQPVSGEAAKKLLEAIDSGSTVVNDRVFAVFERSLSPIGNKVGLSENLILNSVTAG